MEEIHALLSAFVDAGAPSGRDIALDWLEWLSHGDEACPGDAYTVEVPPEGCLASTGWRFTGIGWYAVYETEEGTAGETVELDWFNGGDFEIFAPDGVSFRGGGEVRYETDGDPEAREISFDVKGRWQDGLRAGWLGQGFSAVYEGQISAGVDGTTMSVTGGISIAETAVFLDGLSVDTGGACPGSPSGAIDLRDERGYWTRWELDADCDGCGALTFNETEPVGELCLPLDDWALAFVSANLPR